MDDQFDRAVREAAERSARTANPDHLVDGTDDDPWSAFGSETSAAPARRPSRRPEAIEDSTEEVDATEGGSPLPGWRRVGGERLLWTLALVLAVAASVGGYALWNRTGDAELPVAAQTGTATITSRPEGLQVVIDDQVRGNTPLTLTLPLGGHQMRIQAGAEVRSLPLTITAGTSVSQYIELDAAASAPVTAGLDAKSQLAGGAVAPGGPAPGKAPAPGTTAVSGVREMRNGPADPGAARLAVVPPGATAASADAPAPSTARTGGWVTFKAPFEMQVREKGRLVGTTGGDRLPLSPGSHQLELVSEEFEFWSPVTIQLAAGATVSQTVNVPNGLLSVNALPWAEVKIDGREVGTTPLANLTIPVGSHEVVWTHPQLGERRQVVAIKVKTATRVGLNFEP